MRAKRRKLMLTTYIFLGIFVVIVGFPLFWMISSAFKQATDLFKSPPVILPQALTLRWINEVLMQTRIPLYFFNSFIVAFATMLINMFVSTLGAYSVTHFDYPGKKLFLLALLSGYMFPAILLLLPIYLMVQKIGLVDHPIGLVLAYAAITVPFSLWLLRSFFLALPKELEEAACVDGTSSFGAFYQIMLPLAAPGILSTGLFVFILSWNEYLFASVLISSDQYKTIPIGISEFITTFDIRWGVIMAIGTLAAVPVIVFFTMIQKYFIGGIISGAIKG